MTWPRTGNETLVGSRVRWLRLGPAGQLLAGETAVGLLEPSFGLQTPVLLQGVESSEGEAVLATELGLGAVLAELAAGHHGVLVVAEGLLDRLGPGGELLGAGE